MDQDAKAASIRRALALAAQQRGAAQLDAAERICGEILKADARNADAFYLLAAIAQDRGQGERALEFLDKAIAANPQKAAYHLTHGALLRAQRRLDEALAAYRRALALQADSAEAQFGLGNVLRDQGDLAQAQAHYRSALAIRPGYPQALSNLGALLQSAGDLAGARTLYEQSLAASPNAPEVLNNLGVIEKAEGRDDAALEYYRKALALKPGYPEARYNLGNAYKSAGRYAEAAACYEAVIAQQPGYADAYTNLGNLRKEAGRFDDALALYRRTLELKPNSAEALHNVGTILREQGRLEQAAGYFRKALEADPGFGDAYTKLGNIAQDQGALGEAAALFRQGLARGSESARMRLAHLLQMMCDWQELPELSRQLRGAPESASREVIDPFALVCLDSTLVEQQRCARRWTARILQPVAALRETPAFAFERAQRPRLRVGYLSGDFREHVVATLIPELFELHDRAAFEVFAYAYGADDGSAARRRIQRAVDRFVDVDALSFAAAAQRMHADGIDLLVDLTGHTKGTRTQILALRPAPILVGYLGYPGTLGGVADYIVADRFVIPPQSAGFYDEKPVYLPHSYLVNDRSRAIGAPTTRAAHGLPEDAFVFCCFNQSLKIMPEVFERWMRILLQVPHSVLWLGRSNRWATGNLQREARARDVDPARLIFAGRVPENSDHLARIRLADLFLDTLPYNAHATASDALWAGLPVLTCAGESFASRVAGSLLHAVGLPELVTSGLADYEQAAVALAGDPARLAQLRARLAENRGRAPLFDTPRFVAALEDGYRAMWARFAAGLPPETIHAGAPGG